MSHKRKNHPPGSQYDKDGHPDIENKLVPSTQCPYLDSVDRHELDFDFEKLCSVTLVNQNVYACLVCGQYFQGRGKQTPAFTHSVEKLHHVFMNLVTGAIYCLPDNYQVFDSSLDDIKYCLRPTFTSEQIQKLDSNTTLFRDLSNTAFLPGFVGLNNLKHSDYANAVFQVLAHVTPLRDFFLSREKYSTCSDPVVLAFGDLMCKLWSSHKFKSSVSPHELLQAISVASKKKFKVDEANQASHLFTWLLNRLHQSLKQKKQSIITKTFQGRLSVKTYTGDDVTNAQSNRLNFYLLSLDLPATPLFKDVVDGKSVITQTPIYDLLAKYDGRTLSDVVKPDGSLEHRQCTLEALPPYLVFHVKRFSKNNWYVEKNSAIVQFPINNLDMGKYLELSESSLLPSMEAIGAMSVGELKNCAEQFGVDSVLTGMDKGDLVIAVQEKVSAIASCKYNLCANICHDLPDSKDAANNMNPVEAGSYRVHVKNKATDQWYEIQDLHVKETIPQLISLSETYMLVFERV